MRIDSMYRCRQAFSSAVPSTFWIVPLLLLIGLALTGCGGHSASVSGTITLDGKHLPAGANGGIVFHPVDGGAPATTNLSQEGTYTLSTGSRRGLEPGRYRVAINVLGPLPPRLKDGTQRPGKVISDTHDKDGNRSGFEVEIKSGHNRFDFDVHGARTGS